MPLLLMNVNASTYGLLIVKTRRLAKRGRLRSDPFECNPHYSLDAMSLVELSTVSTMIALVRANQTDHHVTAATHSYLPRYGPITVAAR